MPNGKTIQVTVKLSNATPIGVTMQNPGVFTNSEDTTLNDASKFTSDNPDYAVCEYADGDLAGQLYLGTAVTVTFDANGHGVAPDGQTVVSGSVVDEPEDLTAEGYEFGGWYREAECKTAWDFETDTVTNATTLYAKWTPFPATAPTVSGPQDLELSVGYADGSVGVTATAAADAEYELSYQWYQNTKKSVEGGTAVGGATGASYAIPAGKAAGTTEYYYCVVTATRADNGLTATATSDVATVTVKKKDEPVPPADSLALAGSGHLQDTGDVDAKASGKGISIGTTGQARRLEQFSVSLPKGTDGSIRYRAHLQNTGWCGWVEGGRQCGTRGESRRVEAVQMELSGKVADGYSVWYRVHSQDYGWLGWARDGQAAGTAGQAKRAEDVEVQVLPKGQVPEGYSEGRASYIGAATANVHLQGTGWTGSRSALSFGTTGQSRRLEAVRISLGNQPLSGGVEYDVHLQGKGWQNGYADGATAGTTGQSRRLEAVRIRLTGDMAKQGGYSVWYRVHSQTYGWLGWAKDGGVAGTTGLAKRAEAIEVQVLPQGQVPSGYDVGKAASVIG